METWCEYCEEVRIYPHDCPYVAGVRHAPELIVKDDEKPKKVPLGLSMAVIAMGLPAGWILYRGCFWFWEWMGTR